MNPEQAEELYKLLETKVDTEEKEDVARQIRRFMRKHHLPFLATDRSVLNLPAIGKSMTFQLVGLTEEGKRILRFEHDSTRHHGGRSGRLRIHLELYERRNRTSFQPLRIPRFPLPYHE